MLAGLLRGRRCKRWCLSSLLVVFLCGCVFIVKQTPESTTRDSDSPTPSWKRQADPPAESQKPPEEHTSTAVTTEHSLKTFRTIVSRLESDTSLEALRDTVARLNKEERILNAERYPALSNDGIVVIVQVHTRVGYLRYLIESLKAARDVASILLVVSHDFYSVEINSLVRNITFCKVLQIYYPLSIQLYPNTFPGTSPNDCPRDYDKRKAVSEGCLNAQNPDSYGHYREAKFTATKHHWWWKINTVFDGLSVTKGFSGFVIFLEEDHYVSPDFVHTAQLLVKTHQRDCPECDLITLGLHTSPSYSGLSDKVKTKVECFGNHNMGFGMNREFWNKMKACSQIFCTYDDYNWDWTINSMSSSCFKRKLSILIVEAPRVQHIGWCGGMHKKAACDEAAHASKARQYFSAQSSYLFPSSLNLRGSRYPGSAPHSAAPFGGWGDPRDHKLCLSFVHT